MEISLQYAYLLVVGVFGILWMALFLIYYQKTHRIQLLISALAIPLGPAIEVLYYQDYWHPVSAFPIYLWSYSLFFEDMAFAFFFTGVVGMIAHISGKKVSNPEKLRVRKAYLIRVGVVSMLISLPFIWLLGWNSICVTSVAFLCAAATARVEKEAYIYALRCGGLTALLMFVIYIAGAHLVSNSEELLKSMWLLYDNHPILGFRLLGAPLVWIIWGFSFGAMVGAVRHRIFA